MKNKRRFSPDIRVQSTPKTTTSVTVFNKRGEVERKWIAKLLYPTSKVIAPFTMDALLGAEPGMSQGCFLTRTACDFFKEAKWVATTLSTMLVGIDPPGNNSRALKYEHCHRDMVMANDEGRLYEHLKANPKLVERGLRLKPARDSRTQIPSHLRAPRKLAKKTGEKKSYTIKNGALGRILVACRHGTA
jgi:hypothetical protein